MQKNARTIAGSFTLFIACLGLSACGIGGSTVTKTITNTVTVAPTTNNPTPTDQPTSYVTVGSDADEQTAIAYLQSPGRVARFESFTNKAGIVIAQALQAGTFGEVDRYNSNKKPLQTGEVGYGGIASKTAFAWIYWNADGSIDYSKPIRQIELRNASGAPQTDVSLFEPVPDPRNMSYWTVFKNIGDTTEVTDTSNIGSRIVPVPSPSVTSTSGPQFYYPYSLDELKQLDDDALNQLQANMVSWFGPNWNS